jgi:PleD family two-component response regulator
MISSKGRILIIDDDSAHLDSTRGILEADGYEVATHQRAFGATNVVRDLEPDLVLLDVNMPGLSGESLFDIFRANERTREVPVIFYSSNDEDALRASVSRLGAHGYISKGNPANLRTRLARYMRQIRPDA